MIPYPLLWEGAVRTVRSHLGCIPNCSEVPDTPSPLGNLPPSPSPQGNSDPRPNPGAVESFGLKTRVMIVLNLMARSPHPIWPRPTQTKTNTQKWPEDHYPHGIDLPTSSM